MILINFSNQLAAGPKNISLNFIKNVLAQPSISNFIFILPKINEYLEFSDNERVKFIFIDEGHNIISKIRKAFFVNFILMKKLKKQYDVKSVLAFGNFLLNKLDGTTKVVLLHHPYIVDDVLFDSLSFIPKTIEFIKRIAFKFTVKNVDKVVVQSDYMKNLLVNKYPEYENKVEIIFNPVSECFNKQRNSLESEFKTQQLKLNNQYQIIYVSRYYPHKNHAFILDLAKYIKMKNSTIELLVTINPEIAGTDKFLKVIKDLDLPILNIGEIAQDQLIPYYKKCHMAIFPSYAETFGNPLIEAMYFSLPLITPQKDYSEAIVGIDGLFYKEDSVESCFSVINSLLSNSTEYKRASEYSYIRSMAFPNSVDWYEKYHVLLEK
jgi:glycosyltransferase involved in cell wall biosynthesis